MLRKQEDGQHEYKLTPNEGYDEEAHSTYDQFIQLRDTLVFSNKFYGDSAGRSLIIGVKTDGTPTNTIEIRTPNIFRQGFEPTGDTNGSPIGRYIQTGGHTQTNPMSCEIMKDGRYVLQHKEQFKNIDTDITRITTYILQHHASGGTTERAVFDWEWNTAGEMKRMTAFGYVECDLKKGDWLELVMKDQDDADIPLSELQVNSNRWSIEYKDLIYNN